MSMTFTKLFSSITESSIWMQDDHTRIVWIAMLAMADKRGRVWASVPGLANRSRVPVASVERAIEIFLAPDTYSRTKDNEGQRIAEIDGGWRLLNHQKYRDMRDDEDRREQNREAQQRARAKVSKLADSQQPSANSSAQAEAEAEAEAERKDTVGDWAERIYQAYPLKVGKPSALKAIRKVIAVEDAEMVLRRVEGFAKARPPGTPFTPHPATFFNARRFEDDPATWAVTAPALTTRPSWDRSPTPESNADIILRRIASENHKAEPIRPINFDKP